MTTERRRRRSGGGGVFKRATASKATRWMGTLELPRVTGKRKRLTFYGADEKSVWARVDEARRKLERGTLVIGPRCTVGEWLAHWLREIVEPVAAPSYYRRCRDLSNQYLIPVIGAVQLSKLTTTHVRAVINGARAHGLAPQTVHHVYATLRAALNRAVKEEMFEANIAKRVDPPKVPAREHVQFTYDQAAKFFEAIKSDRLQALFSLAIRTGVRQGELLGLHWSDVDLEAGTIKIGQQLQRVEGKGLVLRDTKSRTSHRTVSLSEAGLRDLREHRNRQNVERLATKRWKDNDLVFCGDHGKPLDGTGVTKRWRRIRDAAGLPPATFRDLRHNFASFYYAIEHDAQKGAAILGHADHGTLFMKTYSRVVPGGRPNDVSALDAALGG